MPSPTKDHLPAGLFISDGDGKVIYVNERWCEIAGISAEEAKGEGWRKIIHPDDLELLAERWLAAVAARQTFFGDHRYRRPDGTVVWVEVEAYFIESPDVGKAVYMGTCTDTTTRRQNEARFRLYETLLSNNPDFAYVFDVHGHFIYANQSLLTMWGKTWDESIGKDLREIGYQEWHAAMHEREIATVVATGKPITGEVHFDGTHGRRLYEYIFSPIFADDGSVEAVAGATRDVTERKQAEQRATFLNDLSGVLMTLRSEEEIIGEAVRMLGQHLSVQHCYFIETMKGENLLRVAPDWHREDAASISGEYSIDSFGGEEWWRRYSSGPLMIADVEKDPLTSTRADAYFDLGIRAFITHPYRRVGPWSVVLAVTEGIPRQWTEADVILLESVAARVWPLVEQARGIESLLESDRRKDQFLATLAHELRNPLAPVLTGLEIMRRASNDPKMVEHITGIIERQTRQMAHLINDLLDISRVNTGKITLKKEAVSFRRILENSIEASQPLFDERRHALTIDLPLASVIIAADPARIAQVVSNLLSNAAKYTPEAGRISLEAGIDGNEAWVRVTDNGQGIELEEQDVIFDLFHQTKNGSADGLGIGLTLVRSLMRMHGGTITVHSEGRGRGSEFSLHLPGSVVTHADSPGIEPALSLIPAARRALVVDDGKSNADVLAMLLKLEGLEVEVAYNGLEGLEKSRTFRPDFVLMDIGMPVMDGLEAAAHMRSEKLPATLIALSGWGREEDRRRTKEAGFDYHLTKPVSPADLQNVLTKVF